MKFSQTLLLFAATTLYLTNVSAQIPTNGMDEIDLITTAPTPSLLIDAPTSNPSSTGEDIPIVTTVPMGPNSPPASTPFEMEETMPFPSAQPAPPAPNNPPVPAVNVSSPEPVDTTPVPPGPRMPVTVSTPEPVDNAPIPAGPRLPVTVSTPEPVDNAPIPAGPRLPINGPPSNGPIIIGEGTVPPFPSSSPMPNPVGPRPAQPIATFAPIDDMQESSMPIPDSPPNMANNPGVTTAPADMDGMPPMTTTPGDMGMMPTTTTDGIEDGEGDMSVIPTSVPVPPVVTIPDADNTDAPEEPDFSPLVAPTVTPTVVVPVGTVAESPAVFVSEEPTEPTEVPRDFVPEATITPTPEVEASPIGLLPEPVPVPTILADPESEPSTTPISDTEALVVGDGATPLPVESVEALEEDDDSLPDAGAVTFDPVVGEATPEGTDDPACFPADATVQTENGETVRMSDLDVGHRVLTANGVYSDVFMFTHRLKDTISNFVALETSKGQTLRLSPGHKIKIDNVIVAARDAKIGGAVNLADGSIANIVEKNLIKDSGLYNPQTLNGDIVVNGVLATTYTEALPMTCAHSMLSVFRMMYNWFNASLHIMDGGVYGAKVAQNVFSSLA